MKVFALSLWEKISWGLTNFEEFMIRTKEFSSTTRVVRDQARGRLGRNGRPGGRNFALNGTQGEVGVSLKKKKKKKKKFFFFFFFLGRLIFILSPHKCKLW